MKKLIAAAVLFVGLSILSFAKPIYSYQTVVPISDTVSLTQVKDFYADYNMSYSYIKADISDVNTDVVLLKSDEGADVLDKVNNLAKTNDNTVAALNADFFSAEGGGKGFSLGIEIKDGALLQSPIYPGTMATTAYDGSSVLMSYMEFQIMAVAPSGNYHNVRHLNKHTSYYGDILMYTSDFNGGYSPAPGGEVVEVVVSGGKIVEFRRNMPSVQIPKDGCVLVVSEGVNMFLANNFSVGDEIRFDYYITPALYNYTTAFGGGSMLVYEGKDYGKITDYSHTVAGFHPRSAIGVTQDGKTLYLLAVDGRQDSSRGMRMSHVAELMIELGCYYAVNLDGGGSTNMVASTLWQNELHTVNSPTENRSVINAVGITHNAETSEPYGMLLKTDAENVFAGQNLNVEITVFDKHKRSVGFDKKNIEWSATSGSIRDGIYTAGGSGNITISAIYGDLYADITVNVVDTISGISVNGPLNLEIGGSADIEVAVFDYNGQSVRVDDLSGFEIVSGNTGVVKVSDGKIQAVGDGTALVSVSKNGVTSYISVAVGSRPFNYFNGFEKAGVSSSVYPYDTKGESGISTEQSYSGKSSAKIRYDFTTPAPSAQSSGDVLISYEQAQTEQDITRAVYLDFDEKILIDDTCQEISLMFYSPSEFTHKLRAEIALANGETKLIDFEGSTEAGSWTRLLAQIPKRLSRPVKLSKIYVVYTPGQAKDEACVYIDELEFVSCEPYTTAATPAFTYRKDGLNSNVNSTVKIATLCDYDAINPINSVGDQKVKSYASDGIILGQSGKVTEDKNALYIHVDASKGGIRDTNYKQWNTIVERISASNKKYVFILSSGSIFGDDEFENDVISDYLASCGKEVVVVMADNFSTYCKSKGVSYITVDNTPKASLSLRGDKVQNAVEFYFGDILSFEFKSI